MCADDAGFKPTGPFWEGKRAACRAGYGSEGVALAW